MTEESLKQANLIKQELDRLTKVKHEVQTYLNERLELDITIKKGLMNFNASEDTTRHYTLSYDHPLCIAVEAAIEGMREELQDQLDNLDSNMESKFLRTFEDNHPLARTSWWDKALRWCKPK